MPRGAGKPAGMQAALALRVLRALPCAAPSTTASPRTKPAAAAHLGRRLLRGPALVGKGSEGAGVTAAVVILWPLLVLTKELDGWEACKVGAAGAVVGTAAWWAPPPRRFERADASQHRRMLPALPHASSGQMPACMHSAQLERGAATVGRPPQPPCRLPPSRCWLLRRQGARSRLPPPAAGASPPCCGLTGSTHPARQTRHMSACAACSPLLPP